MKYLVPPIVIPVLLFIGIAAYAMLLQRRTRSRDSTETARGILPLRLLRSRSRVSSPAMGNNLGRLAAEYPHLRKIGAQLPATSCLGAFWTPVS
jgi:hypothetical protein